MKGHDSDTDGVSIGGGKLRGKEGAYVESYMRFELFVRLFSSI